jgi:transposase InsO family protein
MTPPFATRASAFDVRSSSWPTTYTSFRIPIWPFAGHDDDASLEETTHSDHRLEVYLDLARRMTLTAIDQLWVADITYIRLKAEFVYLAVILDSFSRKVVGWALVRTLASRLAITALR